MTPEHRIAVAQELRSLEGGAIEHEFYATVAGALEGYTEREP
jgi:hypothetical protein